MRSYFSGNERARNDELVELMGDGKTVALVSDAGMPVVSDPGSSAVEAAYDAGAVVTAIPGPSAARSFATRAKDFLRDKPRLNAAARRMWRALHVALPQRRPAATVAVHYPPLPDWFLAEWQAMHQIEPALLPTTDRGSSIPRYHVPHSWGAAAYQQAAAQWKLDRTHVFLLPWIKRGGSDLEILHHMRALSELGCTRQLCITTETCDSPWLSHVPTGTDVLEFGKLCKQHQLGEEVSLAVLARLLVQRSPEVVHIANSLLGLRLYARHGQALSKVSRLFLSIFCPDYSVDGYGGYAYEFLETLFPHLSAVFCDNQRFVDEVVEKYDFGRDRFQVLRFPTESTAPTRNAASGERLQVVWASRLDRQKRPDVLLEVIERCQPLPVQFHVYGSPALECNSYPQRLRACAT